jgi:hypothetical protein
MDLLCRVWRDRKPVLWNQLDPDKLATGSPVVPLGLLATAIALLAAGLLLARRRASQ